jgi:AcrR family transcriptional regulator
MKWGGRMSENIELWIAEMLRLNNDEDKMTDKQIKIINAAVETFSEKGFAASSTSEIAQKAGVAEGTIFRHYKTKKDLLLSIVAPALAKLIAPFVLKDFNKVLNSAYPK